MKIEYVKTLAVCGNRPCFATEVPDMALSGSIVWIIVYHLIPFF